VLKLNWVKAFKEEPGPPCCLEVVLGRFDYFAAHIEGKYRSSFRPLGIYDQHKAKV
jgi:hypothetical protein